MFKTGRKLFIQIFAIIVIISMAFFGVGRVLDSIIGAYYRSPPPGELIEVNGRKIHIHCQGTGSPTVVFDSGLGFHSLDWHEIQEEISKITRTCSYDRPGYGWSEEAGQSRTSLDIVWELHELLGKAGEKPPYILVGHAFGGLNMRLFATLFPAEVEGLVLLDPSHEDMIAFFPVKVSNPAQNLWSNLYLFLAKSGLHRILSRNFIEQKFPKLPEDIKKVYQANHSEPKTLGAAYREDAGFIESLQQMREFNSGLGLIPVTVLTSGREKFAIPNITKKELDILHANVVNMHQKLAKESTKGRQMTLEESGHFIHYDNPEKVIEVIKKMIKEGD